MKEWIDFKKSFTREQEDALWQYFIDHSQVAKTGYIHVQFFVKDLDDFWKRLYARFTGDFARYDKLEKLHTQETQSYHYMRWQAKVNQEVATEIENGKSLYKKFLLFLYRKTRNAIFPKAPFSNKR